MRMRFAFLFLITVLLGSSVSPAQSLFNPKAQGDFNDWNLNKLFKWRMSGDPFLEFNYGFGNPAHKKLASEFSDIGLVEIKLGYSRLDEAYDTCFVEIDERYVFISSLATKLQSERAKTGELDTEVLRFGLGRRTGFGYDFGSIQFLPYSEYGIAWSRLKVNNPPSYSNSNLTLQQIEDDKKIIDRYSDEFRFGTASEAGIRFQIMSSVSINAAYEAAVVFPRHLVWKHLGNIVIEGAAISTVEYFVEEVLDSSPGAAPIVNFLLKNGLAYGFYVLKKENMNWPFKTETPLTFETFKIGLSFVF